MKSKKKNPHAVALGRKGGAAGSRANGGNGGGFRDGAGKKATLVKCPRCGETVTKTQAARGHGCLSKTEQE